MVHERESRLGQGQDIPTEADIDAMLAGVPTLQSILSKVTSGGKLLGNGASLNDVGGGPTLNEILSRVSTPEQLRQQASSVAERSEPKP